jgi:hypothetical protein
MKKLMAAAAGLLLAASAQANQPEFPTLEVDMPITEAQKPLVSTNNAAPRFEVYAMSSR